MTARPQAPATNAGRAKSAPPASGLAGPGHADAAASESADRRTGRPAEAAPQKPGEVGGSDKPEPTRYGDWEVNGRCSDF